jgi:hypothetical protein
MKDLEEGYLKVAGKIEEAFKNGFCLDSKVLHYIDSTFSNPSATEIEKLLTDESDFEKETLLKLIFSPDESTRILLEESFEEDNPGEEEQIRAFFSTKRIRTKIRFPDERGTLEIILPPRVVDEFVLHLNISKRLEEKLTKAVGAISCEKRRVFAKVKLKDAGKAFSEKTVDFFTLFFEKLGEDKDDFNECFELVMEVLCEAGNDADIYSAFLFKKAASYQSLLCSERFEEQLQKNNIETLLMQGVRPVSIDKDAAIRKINIINRICLAVFGKTEVM